MRVGRALTFSRKFLGTNQVIPEDFERPRDRLIIPHGGFPVAKAVGVQSRFPQNVAHCRVMNAVHIALINSGLSQTPMRPMREVPTYRSRFTTGQPFNPLALAPGN